MLLLLVLTAGPALAGGAEAPAETSATDWLVLVDKGRFSEAWEKGATVFRNGLTLMGVSSPRRRRRRMARAGGFSEPEVGSGRRAMGPTCAATHARQETRKLGR